MNCTIQRITPQDRELLLEVFGKYLDRSFDAFAEVGLPLGTVESFLSANEDYPSISLKNEGGEMLGFGLLRPYIPHPSFVRALEISYFIRPEYAGQGWAGVMLEHLSHLAAERGASSLLVCIASLNQAGLDFHIQNGFYQCACFHRIGLKKGREFDLVWMQKPLWNYLEELEGDDDLVEF